jgi:hypothetical protein
MLRAASGNKSPGPKTQRPDFWRALKEVSMFFQGRGKVHQTMRRLVKRLEKADISYAIGGGMGVVAHKHERTTRDLDVLLTREGFAEFKKRFVPKSYGPFPKRPRRFVDRANKVNVDILVTGLFPGSGKPGPVAYPDPAGVSEPIRNIRVVDLVTLIQLKLSVRRYQDLADVVALVRCHDLDESFADRLDPSVRRDYIECLEEKRREDEYEARQD